MLPTAEVCYSLRIQCSDVGLHSWHHSACRILPGLSRVPGFKFTDNVMFTMTAELYDDDGIPHRDAAPYLKQMTTVKENHPLMLMASTVDLVTCFFCRSLTLLWSPVKVFGVKVNMQRGGTLTCIHVSMLTENTFLSPLAGI